MLIEHDRRSIVATKQQLAMAAAALQGNERRIGDNSLVIGILPHRRFEYGGIIVVEIGEQRAVIGKLETEA